LFEAKLRYILLLVYLEYFSSKFNRITRYIVLDNMVESVVASLITGYYSDLESKHNLKITSQMMSISNKSINSYMM